MRGVGVLWVVLGLGCAGAMAHQDYDRLCVIVTEEAARDDLDPAQQGASVAHRVRDELSPMSALRNKVFPAIGAVEPEHRYELLRQAALESGYPEWTCAAMERWATEGPPREDPLPDETALVHELQASEHPLRKATTMLSTFGARWYGREVPVGLVTNQAPAELQVLLGEAGCASEVAALPLDSPRAADLLAGCAPRGPHLLGGLEVAESCTVGRAELALLLDAWATDERRISKLHQALMAALLSGLDGP